MYLLAGNWPLRCEFLWNGMQSSPLERVKAEKDSAPCTAMRQSKDIRVKLPGLPLFQAFALPQVKELSLTELTCKVA